jgi:hypothetical protein
MGHMTFAAVPGFVADAARLMTAQDASPAAGNGRRNAGRNGNGSSA